MGRKSTKENKNIYHISRENVGLTREAAADIISFISADRIEKIENERVSPNPSDIVALADCYNDPYLCNHYCSNECPIGQTYIPEITNGELPSITLNILSSLNSLEKDKDNLIDLASDGKITDDEVEKFKTIQQHLEEMALTIQALQLWVKKAIGTGKVANKLNE